MPYGKKKKQGYAGNSRDFEIKKLIELIEPLRNSTKLNASFILALFSI